MDLIPYMALIVAAAAATIVLPPPRSGRFVALAGITILAPIPFVLAGAHSWTDREGGIEAVTAGILAGLFVLGVRHRSPWITIAALLLLLEELDYGQVLLGFETPEWHAALPSRSGKLNFHNIRWLDWLWEPLPIYTVSFLALPLRGRLLAFADRLRAPRFHRRIFVAIAVAAACGLVTWWITRELDEIAELTQVAIVAATWLRPGRGKDPVGIVEPRQA